MRLGPRSITSSGITISNPARTRRKLRVPTEEQKAKAEEAKAKAAQADKKAAELLAKVQDRVAEHYI